MKYDDEQDWLAHDMLVVTGNGENCYEHNGQVKDVQKPIGKSMLEPFIGKMAKDRAAKFEEDLMKAAKFEEDPG